MNQPHATPPRRLVHSLILAAMLWIATPVLAGDVGKSTKAGGFTFTLTGCELAGSVVTCRLTLEATGKDREFSLYEGKIINNEGYEYKMTDASLLEMSGPRLSKLIITGIRPELVLKFPGVSPNTTIVRRLWIFGAGKKAGHAKLQFVDIPLAAD